MIDCNWAGQGKQDKKRGVEEEKEKGKENSRRMILLNGWMDDEEKVHGCGGRRKRHVHYISRGWSVQSCDAKRIEIFFRFSNTKKRKLSFPRHKAVKNKKALFPFPFFFFDFLYHIRGTICHVTSQNGGAWRRVLAWQ